MATRIVKKSVTFTFKGHHGMDVFVAGSFNDWDPRKTRVWERKGDGTYVTRLRLPPGRHEYKFVINGNWHIDPECPEHVPNEHGSLNSVVTV